MEIKEKTLQLLEDLPEDKIEVAYQFLENLSKKNLIDKSRPKNYLHAQTITNKLSGNLSDILLKERHGNI